MEPRDWVSAWLHYEMLEDIKLITFQPEIPHLIHDVPCLCGWSDPRNQEISVKNRLKNLCRTRLDSVRFSQSIGCFTANSQALEKEKFDPSLPLACKIGRLFELPIEQVFQYD